jgi:diguanylate cyclase (GGDEF)-like protein
MQTITRYLDALRESVDGDELHGLIARTLRRHSKHGPATLDCLIDLHGQLDAYARDALTHPSMRIRARLLQQHISPYLYDLKAEAITQPAHTARVAARTAPSAAPAPEPPTPSPPSRNGAEVALEGVLERPSEQRRQAKEERAEKYQDLLRSEKDAWQAIYGTVKDYQRLKDAWLKSLDDLARQRDELERKLGQTKDNLTKLETEHDQLRTQLEAERAEVPKRTRGSTPRLLSRLASRPGPLTKRESFVRLLQAEIKRCRRSGAPLALGLIGIESLDTVVEHHGAEAATAALRCYAEEILSNFRAYDVVALYDRDQFAVMFPDTGKEGARRALEKAYKRAIETHMNHAGASIPLPPFAGALVTYSPGEDPSRFLVRADDALSGARNAHRRGVALY